MTRQERDRSVDPMRRTTRIVALLTVIGSVLAGPSAVVPVLQDRTGADVSGGNDRVVGSMRQVCLETEWPDVAPDDRDRIVRAVEVGARRFDLDPFLVLAVIEVESGFDREAVSDVGALGLMQLRPLTARWVAAELGLDYPSDAILFDPEPNILLGSCYLRLLLDRFGDVDMALVAFNAGPGRVSARYRRTGGIPYAYADRVRDAVFDLKGVALSIS